MLDSCTMETFTPHIGELFRIVVDDTHELHTQLTSVDPWGDESARGRPRVPFSLIFHAAPDSFLPQQIYRVENASLEPLELFIVCIGPDERGMRYEAVIT